MKRTTKGLLDTFKKCSPSFSYSSAFMNPKKDLTFPNEPVHNFGYDNQDYDYILRVSDLIVSPEGRQ